MYFSYPSLAQQHTNNMHTNCSNFYLYSKVQALICMGIKIRIELKLLQFITYITFSSRYKPTELKYCYAFTRRQSVSDWEDFWASELQTQYHS